MVRWVVSSWKVVVGVAGGLTTILILFFTLFPGRKPGEPCRGQLGGTLGKITVDERVRQRKYLEHEGSSAGSASEDELNSIGRVVHFSIETHGFKGEHLPIYWWVLTRDGEPVGEPGLARQFAYAVTPTRQACADSGRRAIWVKLPKRGGAYKIEIKLFDPIGNELDEIPTTPFVWRGQP